MSWSIRHFASVQVRQLSIGRVLQKPSLSGNYKAKGLWDSRLRCDLLGDDLNLIKTINSKIMSNDQLNNLELDVFINIATARGKDVAQLQEVIRNLGRFRRSLSAHTLLPSTSHAVCRLFLDSGLVESLVRLLEKRVDFGVFPDSFMLNLLFDNCLEQDKLALASRLAALIMLQEEFGQNQLNDNFSLYSVAKYIESKTDFEDWSSSSARADPILDLNVLDESVTKETNPTNESKTARQQGDEEEGEDEEEEDAEYIRVPFLRNPYNDRHFDLTSPRQICGKTLSMLGHHLIHQLKEENLGNRCQLLGQVLEARWSVAIETMRTCLRSRVAADATLREAIEFYLTEPHDLEPPGNDIKSSLLIQLNELPRCESSISHEADMRHPKLKDLESEDIAQLHQDITSWSQLRHATKQAREHYEERQRVISEIKTKREELKQREQYLYFYDNLKRNNLSRINYD